MGSHEGIVVSLDLMTLQTSRGHWWLPETSTLMIPTGA